MNPDVLWHYTTSLDKLISILENGFYYSFYPTRVFDQLFKDAKVDAMEPDDHAMICFTETNSIKMREKFGLYGIGISTDWAIANGAKKVNYIKRSSDEYNELLIRLKGALPKKVFGYDPMEQNMPGLEKTLRQQMLGHSAGYKVFGAEEDYPKLLKEIQFMQTESHKEQDEWRIRNPISVGGVQQRNSDMDNKFGRIHKTTYNRKHFMGLFMSHPDLQRMMFLKIYPTYLYYLIIPKEEEQILRSKVNLEFYKNLELILI